MLRIGINRASECLVRISRYLIHFDLHYSEVISTAKVVFSLCTRVFHAFRWPVSEPKITARILILISKVIYGNVIAKLNVHIFLMVNCEISVLVLIMLSLMG